jgi:hypothetical protein
MKRQELEAKNALANQKLKQMVCDGHILLTFPTGWLQIPRVTRIISVSNKLTKLSLQYEKIIACITIVR